MVNLLRDLISGLDDTVGAWDDFWRKEIGYFQDDDEPLASSSSLELSIAAVGKAMSTLKTLLLKLKDLEKKLCKDNPQGVSPLSLTSNTETKYKYLLDTEAN